MTPSTELWDLIHALSQAEKRYFKIYTDKHVIGGENNYLKLFNVLVKMSAYDEEKVKRKFKNSRIAKDLASEKHYLKELIMKSMRAFHADKAVEIRLLSALKDLHFLREKNLIYQFRRSLDRTWKLASEHEHFYAMLKVLEHRRFLHKNSSDKRIDEGMEEILATMQEVIERLANEMEFGHLNDRFFIKTQQQIRSQDKTKLEAIEQILAHPLLQEVENARSFKAGLYFNNIKANYHVILGEWKQGAFYQGRIVEVWDAHPTIRKEEHSRYRRTLSNYMNSLMRLGRIDEMPDIIAKIRNSAGSSRRAKAEKFELGYFSEQLYYLAKLDFTAAENLVEAIEAGLDQHEKWISSGRQFSFIYNNMITFIVQEAYSKALRRLNRILNHSSTEQRKDIQAMSRVFLQMIHYELGNIDILENLNRSASRFMSKEEAGRSFESRALKFFRRLIDLPNEKEVKKACEIFWDELIEAWPKESQHPLGFMELSHWLESKAKGVSIRATIS